jgi:hypothetical protein
MNPQELEILHLTTALRTQIMDTLTDADLAFKFPNNPTLGELCREIGEVQRSYIDSLRTFRQVWGMHTAEPEIETSVERLKAWYSALDDELHAVLMAIPENDFRTKTVQRGGGFAVPPSVQFHIYREALLIFAARCVVYLRAMEKPLSKQIQEWIG